MHAYVCMHLCVYMHSCMRVCVCMHMCVCVCACMWCVCVYAPHHALVTVSPRHQAFAVTVSRVGVTWASSGDSAQGVTGTGWVTRRERRTHNISESVYWHVYYMIHVHGTYTSLDTILWLYMVF